MPDVDLLAQGAGEFAELLTGLLNATITVDAEVTSAIVARGDEPYAIVAPGAAESAPSTPRRPAVPLSVAENPADRDRAPLWLALTFRLVMDPEDRYPAVQTSSVGLVINPDPTSMRQAVRVEYDRDSPFRSAAHVHVSGVSEEFAYAYATSGQHPRRLDKLHIPVGGRRYRPTVEDFIEFLHDEHIIIDTHDGWREHLRTTRRDFERVQLRAAVRRDPMTAVDGLVDLGYEILAPDHAPDDDHPGG